MPLRLSRQMLLDQWNEAIAFVSATLDAKLASSNHEAGVPHLFCRHTKQLPGIRGCCMCGLM
jgi:hypothetical protein